MKICILAFRNLIAANYKNPSTVLIMRIFLKNVLFSDQFWELGILKKLIKVQLVENDTNVNRTSTGKRHFCIGLPSYDQECSRKKT